MESVIFADKIESSSKYVVLVPGVILSEHPTLAEARHARRAVAGEGFEEAIVFKHTDKGWKRAIVARS